jgi:hypothetical protein
LVATKTAWLFICGNFGALFAPSGGGLWRIGAVTARQLLITTIVRETFNSTKELFLMKLGRATRRYFLTVPIYFSIMNKITLFGYFAGAR